MSKLVLIDGNSLINRAFYATPPMSNSNGVQTNAIFGFFGMLLKIRQDVKPDFLLVAFDRKEPTFRHKMFDGYKGTRKPSPPELIEQIMLLKRVLDDLHIARYERAGIEADDIIGTVAKREKLETIIYTGDKDEFQLVDQTTSVYFTKRGISELDIMTVDNFKEKTGILPEQVPDLKACMGDSSDNIPGIAGVGEKTALDLISRYSTVENLYEHTDELKGKLKEKVDNARNMAFLSKTLATIDTAAEVEMPLEEMAFAYPFPYEARKTFVELELKTFLKRNGIFVEQSEQAFSSASGDLDEISERQVEISTQVISDALSLRNALNAKTIALDLSQGVSFYCNGCEFSVKLREGFFDEGMDYGTVIDELKLVLGDLSKRIILFSKKNTEHSLDEFGVKFAARCDDVSLLNYTLSSGKTSGLSEMLESEGLDVKHSAYGLYALAEKYAATLKEEKLYGLYSDIELPLSDVLFDMEQAGFKIDVATLDELNKKYRDVLDRLTAEIYALAGAQFNINSTRQLAEILYTKLGLQAGKKIKTGLSTSADALEKIESLHPIVPLILRYRQIAKLNSTYIEGFKPLIDKRTGLIHTVFNQTLTATGRLSSKEPNLQNIPIRDEIGKEIRRFFVPRDGEHILVGADYSQIELRLLAHFSGCKELIDAYREGRDIHALTASQVFDVPLEQVTKEMRSNAKAVNFGIIYGISDFGLAKNIGTSPKRAGEYIKHYFETYPAVKEYMQSNVEFARKNGYVSTLTGRRRYLGDINSSSFQLRSFSERAAMNMPLQGTSADIIKIAMVNVAKRIKAEGLKSQLILQVHDELIVDALIIERDAVLKLLKEEMENAVKLNVPLVAEAYSGNTWFESK